MKGKKIGILIVIGVLTTLIVGCAPRQQDTQIDQISNLAEIMAKTSELSQQFQSKEITAEQFIALSRELEDKYEELTKNNIKKPSEDLEKMQKNLDEQFEAIKKTIDDAKEVCKLPDRAEKLGLSTPEGLTLEKAECRQTYVDKEGYDSVSLSYEGSYETALQQAKLIAEKAKVPVSAEFEMAKKALSGLSAQEIDQITSGSSLKGIIYTNAGLLATDIEYFITIMVDEKGKLTIEVVNQKQMKK